MRNTPRTISSHIGLLLIILLTFIGCSSRTRLLVDYHVPSISNQLTGQRVHLEVRDMREDRHLFTANAAKDFQGFRNSYELTLVAADQRRTSIGERDLEGLFLEVFSKRLQHLGADIINGKQDATPHLQILIKAFKIDLNERKWIATASYEANLSIDDQLVARERVTGSAERLKIMGTKGAGTTLSDIFTEIINRLNIVKLFEQAKMV